MSNIPSKGSIEAREALRPQKIHVYAVEITRTTEDRVTPQGFAYSPPLESPVTTTTFYWEGNLFPSQSIPGGTQDLIHSFGFREGIEELAENFAENYRDRQNPNLHGTDAVSYSLAFEPPSGKTLEGLRALSSAERQAFLAAFQRANIKATTGN